ncbi:MAG: hypothetical protein K8Q99_06835 [Acholeplasmataceae bacterium]|nr:hypothetical protein [Acholeplasmataceae bacterium]
MNFDQLTTAKLNYYVYALENQETNRIFYVGKGKGNRVFSHQEGVLKQQDMFDGENSNDKNNEIANILRQGNKVRSYIVRWNLQEKEALKLESSIIDLLNLNKIFDLTNIVRGNQTEFGITTTQEISNRFNATPLLESEINDKIIFVNINKEYYNCLESGHINFDKIYEKTRYSWLVALWRANQAKYICTVYRGIVKATFLKEGDWFLHREYDQVTKAGKKIKKKRYAFNGTLVENSFYDNKDVSVFYKKGSIGPIKYTY